MLLKSGCPCGLCVIQKPRRTRSLQRSFYYRNMSRCIELFYVDTFGYEFFKIPGLLYVATIVYEYGMARVCLNRYFRLNSLSIYEAHPPGLDCSFSWRVERFRFILFRPHALLPRLLH